MINYLLTRAMAKAITHVGQFNVCTNICIKCAERIELHTYGLLLQVTSQLIEFMPMALPPEQITTKYEVLHDTTYTVDDWIRVAGNYSVEELLATFGGLLEDNSSTAMLQGVGACLVMNFDCKAETLN